MFVMGSRLTSTLFLGRSPAGSGGTWSLSACTSRRVATSSSFAGRAMLIITQPNATEDQIERVVARVREFGLDAQISRGASRVIIGVIGAEDRIREKPLAAMPGVEAIVPVEKPYKLASYE